MKRFSTGLALLLAVGACAWLGRALAEAPGAGGVLAGERPPEAATAPELLGADRATAPAPPAGPSLGVLRPRDDVARGASVVQVLTFHGEPRPGAPVRVTWADARTTWRITDGDGRVVFGDVRLDGTVKVEAFHGFSQGVAERAPRIPPAGTVRLTSAEHMLKCAGALEMRARFVDAESGADLPGPSWCPVPLAVPEEQGGVARSRDPTRWVTVLPGQSLEEEDLHVGLDVGDDVPRGAVAWDASSWQPAISRYAHALEVVYPLRREARVHVRAEEHDGTPTDRFEVSAFEVAGRRTTRHVRGPAWRATPDADGVWLGGVPFFRERPIHVEACRPRVENEVLELADGPLDIAKGDGRLATTPAIATRIVVRFPRDPGTVFSRGGHRDLFSTRCCARRLKEVPRGAVSLRVLRADGRPAAGALVWCGGRAERTDLDGRVRFEGVREGKAQAWLSEPGLVRTGLAVEVVGGRAVEAVLREAPGSTLEVRVLGPQGRPVPFARVGPAHAAKWVDLRDGVQRLDPFTDEQGVRRLRRFPAGTWRITARWGGLQGEGRATVRAGVPAELVIRLADPDTAK